MATKVPKRISAEELDALMGNSSDWNRVGLQPYDLPAELRGIEGMNGFRGAYFSGSYADPDGRFIGSLDALRQDSRYPSGALGTFKKYQYKFFQDVDNAGHNGIIVLEQEPSSVADHHMSEWPADFEVLDDGDEESGVPEPVESDTSQAED